MVSMLVYVYNYTRSTAMAFIPYYLLYDQKTWHSVNLYYGTQKADMNATQNTKFVQELCERLNWT